MSRNIRKVLLPHAGTSKPFLIKGLLSPSISEQKVPVTLNGTNVGEYQAAEIYQGFTDKPHYPQTVADLVCNSYFRLTYQKPTGTSGTFGTSVVGSMSYKTPDRELDFIPTVEKAEIKTDEKGICVSLTSHFWDEAVITTTRRYSAKAFLNETVMQTEISFIALKDIPIDNFRLGRDSFRFFTASSMFAAPDRFDGDILRYKFEMPSKEVAIANLNNRERYLFNEAMPCMEMELIKGTGSRSARGTPGALDSPSIRIKVIDSSISFSDLAVQGYLAKTTDENADSLSVWLEWTKCPKVISKGKKIAIKIEVSAFPYN